MNSELTRRLQEVRDAAKPIALLQEELDAKVASASLLKTKLEKAKRTFESLKEDLVGDLVNGVFDEAR